MAKDASSAAPKEMVNIRLPAPADGAEGEELPFKMVVMGDFTSAEDDTPIEERKLMRVNQKNLNEIISKMDVKTSFAVSNKLGGPEDEQIPVDLKFDNINSFRPEEVAKQVPQIKTLVELRKRLIHLRAQASRDPQMLKELNKVLSLVFPQETKEADK
jgi:type VI secretion system protein ImpB